MSKESIVAGDDDETVTCSDAKYVICLICQIEGNVEDAVMLMDQQTRRHRGFGFVTFEQVSL